MMNRPAGVCPMLARSARRVAELKRLLLARQSCVAVPNW